MTIAMQEVFSAALVGVVFLAMIVVAEIWKRRSNVASETTRKFVHFFGGLVCATFPFLFRSIWTVAILAAALSVFFLVGRRRRFLSSLHGVYRKSGGSEYYPLSIFLLFVIAGSQPWLFVCSTLVLAVADAFAALIGIRYGTFRYEVENEEKSLEGSLVFGVIAFLAIHIPLLLMTDLPRETCVLSAVLVAILVTGFEAISLSGTDNLFVPLGVAVILSKITTKPIAEIVYQNLSLLAIGSLIGWAVWRGKNLNVGGTLVMILFAYGAWSLGSEWWAMPVLLGFFVYSFVQYLWPAPPSHPSRVKVRIVFRIVLFPLLVLIVANMYQAEGRLYPVFVVMLAVALALGLLQYLIWIGSIPTRHRKKIAAAIGLMAWIVVVLPPWSVTPDAGWDSLLIMAVIPVIASLWNEHVTVDQPLVDEQQIWPACKMILTLGAGAILFLLQFSGLIRPWCPG